jgi:hypothetical protein
MGLGCGFDTFGHHIDGGIGIEVKYYNFFPSGAWHGIPTGITYAGSFNVWDILDNPSEVLEKEVLDTSIIGTGGVRSRPNVLIPVVLGDIDGEWNT